MGCETGSAPEVFLRHDDLVFGFRLAGDEEGEARAEIEGRRVEILMMNERPDGYTQLFVQDPDGYIIEFNSYDV